MSLSPIEWLRGRLSPRRAAAAVRRQLAELDPADRMIVERSLPFSMCGVARLQAVVDAVRYCVRREVRGAFVECGVWRGGSVLAMILTLQELGVDDREVYLYDTFTGMTELGEHDTSRHDRPAHETWREAQKRGERAWPELFGPAALTEQAVRKTLLASGYPEERLHFVAGPVEETIPAQVPDPIAVLRLDTDWYQSTRHELEHLFPILSDGGVLIIDDYGHWEGSRRAVDEYLAAHAAPLLLARSDYTGRIAIKH